MRKKEILSIIIPTKNRQKYAFECIKYLLENENSLYEVVVQDNSDTDELRNMLAPFLGSAQLVYHYSKEILSFCSNFEKAIELSSGDYIILIGDDDGVNLDILKVVDWARKNKVDAVKYSLNVSYTWPNAFSNMNSGELIIRDMKPYIKKVSCKGLVEKMLKRGDFNYQNYSFPQIYHGIIKKEKFDNVKKATGCYFGGLTPDIYSAIALSFFVDSIYYVNYPFSISGVCSNSGTADSRTGKHTGNLDTAPHFRGHDHYEWEKMIPYMYSVETIWAETAIKAIKETKNEEMLKYMDYFHFCCELIMRHPEFKSVYYDYYKKIKSLKKISILTKIRFKINILFRKMNRFIYRATLYLYRLCIGRSVYNKVDDIKQSLDILDKHLKSKNKYNSFLHKKIK